MKDHYVCSIVPVGLLVSLEARSQDHFIRSIAPDGAHNMRAVNTRRARMKLAVTICLVLHTCLSCQNNAGKTIDDSVSIGTHRLHYHCVGRGKPTVVIDVGIGERYTSWQTIVDSVSKVTSVFVYDRASYGTSEPGPLPRHSKQVAEELKSLLNTAKIRGPYVLVGHSLGALNMQVFAFLYPDVVAGMVLLDPSPKGWLLGKGFPELRQMFEDYTNGLLEQSQAVQDTNEEAQRAKSFLESLYSEHKELFNQTAKQLGMITSFGDIELTVIAAGRPNPLFGEYAESYQEYCIEESRRLSEMSSKGEFILVEDSRHHIHLDAPGLVIDQILRRIR